MYERRCAFPGNLPQLVRMIKSSSNTGTTRTYQDINNLIIDYLPQGVEHLFSTAAPTIENNSNVCGMQTTWDITGVRTYVLHVYFL